MQYRAFAHPLNWHPSEVTGSVELLSVYVTDIEEQVRKGIADYRQRAETILVESPFDSESERVVTVHKELDDGTWDLTEIFESYFPNLQRRSALVTLFSFFENELESLCKRIRSHDHLKIDLSDLADKGIVRSTAYLEKIVGLAEVRGCQTWQEIRKIQSIRNLIVHADGKIPIQIDGKPANVVEYIRGSPLLQGGKEVVILEGYLAHALHTFDGYFAHLHASMVHKYGAARPSIAGNLGGL